MSMGGRRWTGKQIERVRRLKAEGYADRQAAAELGRTAQAVKELRRRLGIARASQAGTPASRKRARSVRSHIRNLFAFVSAARASAMGWPGAPGPKTAAVLDCLQRHPWLTTAQVAERLGRTRESADQALYRLRRGGWVVNRRCGRPRPGGGVREVLWSLAPGVRRRTPDAGRADELRLREAASGFSPQTPRPIYRSLAV